MLTPILAVAALASGSLLSVVLTIALIGFVNAARLFGVSGI